MDPQPGWRRLARTLLTDVLAVGSVATAGPALSPAEESEVLDGIELRLRRLIGRLEGQPDDEAVRGAFRQAHPELFSGSVRQRHLAARARPDE